jgi:hypothetical protein
VGKNQLTRLKNLAKRRGVSEASLIREAVDAYLVKAEESSEREVSDPLLSLVGIYRGELPPDAAAEHDRYLYDEDRK